MDCRVASALAVAVTHSAVGAMMLMSLVNLYHVVRPPAYNLTP